MDLIYVLLSICIGVLIAIGILIFMNKGKKSDVKNVENKQNEIVLEESKESFFPAIQIIENNSIVPSSKSLIKNEVVKETLAKMDIVAPKIPIIKDSSKNAIELTKNGKVLFSASVKDANKMLSAGDNKFYGTQVAKDSHLFAGQTKFTKENKITQSLTKQNITSVGMNAASMVVGQYYMSEINDKLVAIKNSINNISAFQTSEYKSRVIAILSRIDEVTKNQIDILSNEEARNNSYHDIKDIEHECVKLLGQANIQISDITKENDLNNKEYFDKVKDVHEWYKWQQITQLLLLKIGDLRYTLANGSEKDSLSHHQFNYYLNITNNVNDELKLWHNNYIDKYGIDIDKQRRKGNLFQVRKKTIGLIKDDWNYNKVDDEKIGQIVCQLDPRKFNQIQSDKKDKAILIQKYKGNYYNVLNDTNN